MKIGKPISDALKRFFSNASGAKEPDWTTKPFDLALAQQIKYQAQKELAQVQRRADAAQRHAELQRLTTGNYSSFFPAYDPSSQYALNDIVAHDTEFADNSEMLQMGALGLAWDKTHNRFTQLPQQKEFNRYYIPKDLSKKIVQTFNVHGLDTPGLSILRRKTGADYSMQWGKSEFADYLKMFGNSIQLGYNNYTADLPVMTQRDPLSFSNWAPRNFDKSILDIYHYTQALFPERVGKEGALKLQNLASEFGVSASQLGLQAHGAMADIVVTAKLFEKLVQKFPNHPATKEMLGALDTKQVLHSHKWVADTWDEQFTGETHLFSRYGFKPPRENLSTMSGMLEAGFDHKTSIREILREGIVGKDAFDKAVEDNNLDLGSYIEEPLEEFNMDNVALEALMAQMKELRSAVANGGYTQIEGARSGSQTLKDVQRAIKTSLKSHGVTGLQSNWQSASYAMGLLGDNPELLGQAQAAFSTRMLEPGQATSANSPVVRYTQAALASIQEDYLKEQAAIYKKGQTLLDNNYGKYRDLDAYKELASKTPQDISATDIRRAKAEFAAEGARRKEAQRAFKSATMEDEQERIAAIRDAGSWGSIDEKRWLAQHQAAKKAEEARVRREAAWEDSKQDAHERVVRTLGDYTDRETGRLYIAAKGGMKAYREELTKLNKEHLTAAKVLKGLQQAAGKGWFVDPSNIYKAAQDGYSTIMNAAQGLAPNFVYKPVKRFGDAFMNSFAEDKANTSMRYKVANGVLEGVSAVAPALGPYGKVVGWASTGVKGIVNYSANKKERDAHVISEGVAMRLNMLGMVVDPLVSLLRGFGNGLKLSINLFKKLGNIWGTHYDFPLTSLSGISSGRYGNMYGVDTLMGFKAGTTDQLHNNWAQQQVALYGLGQMDENRVISSALLGVFDKAYSPYGQGSVQEQLADTVNSINSQINSGALDSQYAMALAANINPELPKMLQQMRNFGLSDYRDLTNGGFRSSLGVKFHNIDEGSWSASGRFGSERSRFEAVEYGWKESLRGVHYGLSRIAAPVWEKFGAPVMNSANAVLDTVARGLNGGKIDWSSVKDSLKELKDTVVEGFHELFGDTDWGGVWGSIKDTISNLLGGLSDIVLPPLRKLMDDLIDVLAQPIGAFIDSMKSFSLDLSWGSLVDVVRGKKTIGDLIQHPSKWKDIEITDKDRNAYAVSEWDAQYQGVLEGEQIANLFGAEKGFRGFDGMTLDKSKMSESDYDDAIRFMKGSKQFEGLKNDPSATYRALLNSGFNFVRYMTFDPDIVNNTAKQVAAAGKSAVDLGADVVRVAQNSIAETVTTTNPEVNRLLGDAIDAINKLQKAISVPVAPGNGRAQAAIVAEQGY